MQSQVRLDTKWRCVECPEAFETFEEWIDHIRNAHPIKVGIVNGDAEVDGNELIY